MNHNPQISLPSENPQFLSDYNSNYDSFITMGECDDLIININEIDCCAENGSLNQGDSFDKNENDFSNQQNQNKGEELLFNKNMINKYFSCYLDNSFNEIKKEFDNVDFIKTEDDYQWEFTNVETNYTLCKNEIKNKNTNIFQIERIEKEFICRCENQNDIQYSNIEFDPKKIAEKPKIENSDLLLTILFIFNNACKYDNKYSRKSNIFWRNILNINEFRLIFKEYKYDTLKKYSNFLQKLNIDTDLLFQTIKENEKLINQKDLR